MHPCLIVLTDFSPAAARARAYAAALAAPLNADLHLVHIYLPPTTTTAIAHVMQAENARYVREARQSLEKIATGLPVSATAELIETDWDEAVQQTLHKYRPLLLVAGLTATDGQLDEWFSNRTLPLTRQTGYPLLLVPQHLPDAALRPPHRLALAVADDAFVLAPGALAVAPLLDALEADIITLCVLPPEAGDAGWQGLDAARHCGLAAMMPDTKLHRVVGQAPAPGILAAVSELSADVLILLDRGHDWVHTFLVDSVTDQILRHTPVPVLLLSANQAPAEA